MVNLNADRNLPPDSTPWGKNIERRLTALERENGLLKSQLNNSDKGLNSLSKSVFSSTTRVTHQYDFQYFEFAPNTWYNTFELDPLITGSTRTGKMLVSGSIPLVMFNNTPTNPANMVGTLGWYITVEGHELALSTQEGQIPFVPESTLVYHDVGLSLPFSFELRNVPNEHSFKLSLSLSAPQELSRSDIRIPAGWSVVTQQI